MKTKLPQEYDQEKKAILEKYLKKHKKTLRSFVISTVAAGILAFSSTSVEAIKLKNLEKNFPIHQVYIDNQNSLTYLKKKLDQYKPGKFPEFLPKEVKNELENIRLQEDSAKISSLEKIIKITEQDSDRIINTFEFKEYSEKKERIRNIKFLYHSGLGFMCVLIPAAIFLSGSYIRHKEEELTVLDKKYGLIPEESQDSTKSSQ